MTVIIGIVGAKGTGKTTAAKYLEERHGARVYAFATPLKEMLRLAFELSEAQLFGTQRDKEEIDPRYGVSPRWLMTRVGTQGCRAVFGEDFWAERTLAAIRADAPAFTVVEDVRFLNEVAALRAAGGKIWKLHRAPDIEAWESDHQSEIELEQIVADVDLHPGAGGLEQLYTALDMACRYHELESWDSDPPNDALVALFRKPVPAGRTDAQIVADFWAGDPELDASCQRAMNERRRDQASFRKLVPVATADVCPDCQRTHCACHCF